MYYLLVWFMHFCQNWEVRREFNVHSNTIKINILWQNAILLLISSDFKVSVCSQKPNQTLKLPVIKFWKYYQESLKMALSTHFSPSVVDPLYPLLFAILDSHISLTHTGPVFSLLTLLTLISLLAHGGGQPCAVSALPCSRFLLDAISLGVVTRGFLVSTALPLKSGNMLKLKSQNPCKERK